MHVADICDCESINGENQCNGGGRGEVVQMIEIRELFQTDSVKINLFSWHPSRTPELAVSGHPFEPLFRVGGSNRGIKDAAQCK